MAGLQQVADKFDFLSFVDLDMWVLHLVADMTDLMLADYDMVGLKLLAEFDMTDFLSLADFDKSHLQSIVDFGTADYQPIVDSDMVYLQLTADSGVLGYQLVAHMTGLHLVVDFGMIDLLADQNMIYLLFVAGFDMAGFDLTENVGTADFLDMIDLLIVGSDTPD